MIMHAAIFVISSDTMHTLRPGFSVAQLSSDQTCRTRSIRNHGPRTTLTLSLLEPIVTERSPEPKHEGPTVPISERLDASGEVSHDAIRMLQPRVVQLFVPDHPNPLLPREEHEIFNYTLTTQRKPVYISAMSTTVINSLHAPILGIHPMQSPPPPPLCIDTP